MWHEMHNVDGSTLPAHAPLTGGRHWEACMIWMGFIREGKFTGFPNATESGLVLRGILAASLGRTSFLSIAVYCLRAAGKQTSRRGQGMCQASHPEGHGAEHRTNRQIFRRPAARAAHHASK